MGEKISWYELGGSLREAGLPLTEIGDVVKKYRPPPLPKSAVLAIWRGWYLKDSDPFMYELIRINARNTDYSSHSVEFEECDEDCDCD